MSNSLHQLNKADVSASVFRTDLTHLTDLAI
jgi:hypothetical protein